MLTLNYPCRLTEEDDGTVTVAFPDVPEALTCGATREQALQRARDALSTALTFYLEDGQPVPSPSRPGSGDVLVSPELQIALKAALADALRESGRGAADLGRLLHMDDESAQRLLDPNRTSRLAALEWALTALGKQILVTTDDKAA